MTSTTSSPAQHRHHIEWIVPGVLLFVLGAMVVVLLWIDHRNIETREAERLQAQARTVDDNLIRQLQGVNSAIEGVRDEFLRSYSPGGASATSDRLKLMADAMPGVRTMSILDVDGVALASSRPELVGKSNRERPYFVIAKKRGDPSVLYVSAPFQSTLGVYIINVGRVLTRPDGSFAGLVIASFNPEYFDVVLRSVVYAGDMHIALVHGQGRIFQTVPSDPALLGLDVTQPGSFFSAHRQSGQLETLQMDRLVNGGEDRITATRSVAEEDLKMDTDLVVAISRNRSAVFAAWHKLAWGYGSFYALCVIAAVVGLWLSQQRRKAFDALTAASAAERQRSADRLRTVADHVPALIAYLDLDLRFQFVNNSYRDKLGFDPEQVIGHTLKEVFGADHDAVHHHLVAALGGVETVYQHEIHAPNGTRYVEATAVPQFDSRGKVEGLCMLVNDFTERRNDELELARSQERLSLALEGSSLALFDWDIANDRIYQSAQAAAMRGLPAAESMVTSAELRKIAHPEDMEILMAAQRDALKGTVPLYQVEFRLKTATGGWVWMRSQGRVVERDAKGRAVRLAGTHAEVTQRKAMEERLRQMAELDNLTGLPNRALFLDRLQQALLRAARGKQAMALLFVDVDHFKNINDSFGHAAGDQLLQVFAERMKSTVRRSDTVARLGGDEFTVILEDIRDVHVARSLAQKLVEAARLPLVLAGRPTSISASIGVAMSVSGELDGAALLHRADTALYEAKRRGRNGYCTADDVEPHSAAAAI